MAPKCGFLHRNIKLCGPNITRRPVLVHAGIALLHFRPTFIAEAMNGKIAITVRAEHIHSIIFHHRPLNPDRGHRSSRSLTNKSDGSVTSAPQRLIQNLGRGVVRGSGNGGPLVGFRNKASVGSLGRCPPEAGDLLQIMLQRRAAKETKTTFCQLSITDGSFIYSVH